MQLLPPQCWLLAIATLSAACLGEGLAHGVEKKDPKTKSKSFGLTDNVTTNSKAFSHNVLGETSLVLCFKEK